MQFQITMHQLTNQVLKHKQHSQNYRLRLQTLNQTRSQIAEQIQSLSKDYQNKIKNLQLKVSKLQLENKQLSKKNNIYKTEIQSFKLRLLQKQKLISSMFSQKQTPFLKQIINTSQKQEELLILNQISQDRQKKQINSHINNSKLTDTFINQTFIKKKSDENIQLPSKQDNQAFLKHQEQNQIMKSDKKKENNVNNYNQNQSGNNIQNQFGNIHNQNQKQTSFNSLNENLVSKKKVKGSNKQKQQIANNSYSLSENRNKSNQQINKSLSEKNEQIAPNQQFLSTSPTIHQTLAGLSQSNTFTTTTQVQTNFPPKQNVARQNKAIQNQQEQFSIQEKGQSIQYKTKSIPPPPSKKRQPKVNIKNTKHKNVVHRIIQKQQHKDDEQQDDFKWHNFNNANSQKESYQNLSQQVQKLQTNSHSILQIQAKQQQKNNEFLIKQEGQELTNTNFFNNFQQLKSEQVQVETQYLSQIRKKQVQDNRYQQDEQEQIIKQDDNSEFYKDKQQYSNKIEDPNLFFNNLGNEHQNNYTQESSIEHIEHEDTSMITNQNMVNLLTQYNQYSQVPSQKKMNKKKAKRQKINVLDPNSFV